MRRSTLPTVVLATAALGGLASGAAAQQPVPEQLTFEAAVQVALERNPAYMRQLNQAESAEYGERQSLGQAFLPSLSANLGFDGTEARSERGLDPFGAPISGSSVTTSSSASQGLSGNMPIFDLQSIRGYAAARARTAAQSAAAALGAVELRTRVGQNYFDAVQRERLREVEARNLEQARAQLAATTELLRLAARQPTDVLGAELDVARAEQSLQQAVGQARKARLQLLVTMGVDLETDFTLASDFRPVFDPASLDLAGLVERAELDSPRMAQQLAQVDAARAGLSAARAARYPSLGTNFSWSRSTYVDGYDAIGEFDLPNQRLNVGLGVSLPLFNRLATSAQIGQAREEAESAAESLREAGLQLEQEVRSAVIDLENAYVGVRLAERYAEIARERLSQGQQLYRLGTIGYTDLQRMYDDVATAERQLVSARYSFSTALLVLEEKVGGTVRD